MKLADARMSMLLEERQVAPARAEALAEGTSPIDVGANLHSLVVAQRI